MGEGVSLRKALAAAGVVNAARAAAGGVIMAAFYVSQPPVSTHLVEQVKHLLAQSRGVVDLDRGVVVTNQAVDGMLPMGLFDQQTIGGQLHLSLIHISEPTRPY